MGKVLCGQNRGRLQDKKKNWENRGSRTLYLNGAKWGNVFWLQSHEVIRSWGSRHNKRGWATSQSVRRTCGLLCAAFAVKQDTRTKVSQGLHKGFKKLMTLRFFFSWNSQRGYMWNSETKFNLQWIHQDAGEVRNVGQGKLPTLWSQQVKGQVCAGPTRSLKSVLIWALWENTSVSFY